MIKSIYAIVSAPEFLFSKLNTLTPILVQIASLDDEFSEERAKSIGLIKLFYDNCFIEPQEPSIKYRDSVLNLVLSLMLNNRHCLDAMRE